MYRSFKGADNILFGFYSVEGILTISLCVQ